MNMKKPLTDAFCRKVKPPPKKPPPKDPDSKKPPEVPLKFWDNRDTGLYFQVSHTGRKTFRLQYNLDGKRNSMHLGVYPSYSLKEARKEALEERKLIDRGINPYRERKKAKQKRGEDRQDTFRKFAEEWYNIHKNEWSQRYQKAIVATLEKKLYPSIGDMPIKEIERHHVLDAINRILDDGTHSVARRAKQYISQIFKLARAERKAENDPTMDLEYSLPKPPKTKNMPAITNSTTKLGSLLVAIDGYKGGGKSVVKYALRLMPLVFLRSQELRFAEWERIDWKESQYYVKSEDMKMDEEHIVPLSRQAIEILKEVRLRTGNSNYVFPSGRSIGNPISERAMSYALSTLISNEKMVIHGFRATARTMIREKLKKPADWIEVQLAHIKRDPLSGAYDRAIYLDDRREMMQEWADKLDEWKAEAIAEANTR